MNKLMIGTMLAVGLCCAKEHCELINKVDEIGYKKFNIMCQETPGFDSVKYEIHLEYKEIDEISMTMFKRETKYEEFFTVVSRDVEKPYCLVSRDTVDEYNVITGSSENYYSEALCERRFKYLWNKLKKLGTYK